jgi:hypothetical protein
MLLTAAQRAVRLKMGTRPISTVSKQNHNLMYKPSLKTRGKESLIIVDVGTKT